MAVFDARCSHGSGHTPAGYPKTDAQTIVHVVQQLYRRQPSRGYIAGFVWAVRSYTVRVPFLSIVVWCGYLIWNLGLFIEIWCDVVFSLELWGFRRDFKPQESAILCYAFGISS